MNGLLRLVMILGWIQHQQWQFLLLSSQFFHIQHISFAFMEQCWCSREDNFKSR